MQDSFRTMLFDGSRLTEYTDYSDYLTKIINGAQWDASASEWAGTQEEVKSFSAIVAVCTRAKMEIDRLVALFRLEEEARYDAEWEATHTA